jgi:hypothetical protein
MTMTFERKHTPGPWLVATRPEIDGERLPDGTGYCVHTGRTEYDRDLGVVAAADWNQDYEPESLARPYLEADAHLIAAAPELLDAALAVLSFWADHGAWGDFSSLTRAALKFAPVADQARRAVAKALNQEL